MNQKKQELEHNELGDILERIRPHAFMIGSISIGVVLAVILVSYLIYTRSQIESSRWQEFFLANRATAGQLPDARQLENVASDNQGTQVGDLARLRAADIDMISSLGQTSDDQAELEALLRRAKKNYQAVVDSDTDIAPIWKRRALHGLAYACETLGEFEDAKQHYQRLVDEAADTPIHQMAVDGLKRVSDPQIVEVVQGYAEWAPEEMAPGPSEDLRRPNIDFPTEAEISGPPENDPPEFGVDAQDDKGDGSGNGDGPPIPPGQKQGSDDNHDSDNQGEQSENENSGGDSEEETTDSGEAG